jgi:hypothetical protein
LLSRPPAPLSALGSRNFILAERRNKCAKTSSRRVRRPRSLRHTLTTRTPTPRLIARFPIQHATQSQSAFQAAKTLARMLIGKVKKFVATRPMARLARKIFTRKLSALALARRLRVSGRRWSLAPPFLAMSGRTLLLARLPTLPMPGLSLTGLPAIRGSPMPRPEQPFASFEQTRPGPRMTALWPRADVPKKRTLVHGRR